MPRQLYGLKGLLHRHPCDLFRGQLLAHHFREEALELQIQPLHFPIGTPKRGPHILFHLLLPRSPDGVVDYHVCHNGGGCIGRAQTVVFKVVNYGA